MISTLPSEILIYIFRNSDSNNLNQCQNVCQHWYSLAHFEFLRSIQLNRIQDIDRFIRSIDYNRKSVYLSAVRSLAIRVYDVPEGYQLTREQIIKLLCRFNKLKDVYIITKLRMFNELDDVLCNRVLEVCQNLNTFQVKSTGERDKEVQLLKFRKLSTVLDLGEFDPNTPLRQFGGVEPLVAGFSRLQQLVTRVPRPRTIYAGLQPEQCSFNQILSILEHLENLRSMTLETNEQAHFFESYLATKSKSQQDQILEKLSKIGKVELHWGTIPCINSLKFVIQYMKNLKVLNVCSLDLTDLTTTQATFLFTDFIDFTLSIQSFKIDLYDIAPSLFRSYFSSIKERIMPAGGELKVDVICGIYEEYTVSLHLEPKKVHITLEEDYDDDL